PVVTAGPLEEAVDVYVEDGAPLPAACRPPRQHRAPERHAEPLGFHPASLINRQRRRHRDAALVGQGIRVGPESHVQPHPPESQAPPPPDLAALAPVARPPAPHHHPPAPPATRTRAPRRATWLSSRLPNKSTATSPS